MIFDFLVPNFDMNLVYAFIIGIIGVILILIGYSVPYGLKTLIKKPFLLIGYFMILGAFIMWFLFSFLTDLWNLITANKEIFIGIVIVIIAGLYIFKDQLIKGK